MNILYSTIPVIAKDTQLQDWDIMLLLDILYDRDRHIMEWKEVYSSISKLTNLGYIVSATETKIYGNIKKIRELFSKYEVKLANPIAAPKIEAIDWLDEYRDIFKGKCKHATPKGNKNVVLTRMLWFMDRYPMYNKEVILKAATLGVNTIQLKYGDAMIPQADNFIVKDEYRTSSGFPVVGKTVYIPGKEYLSTYCEMVQDMINEGKTITTNNINPKYIKSI